MTAAMPPWRAIAVLRQSPDQYAFQLACADLLANYFGSPGHPRAADALVELERAVGSDAGNAEAHADMGRALRDVGCHADALESFDTAISIDPGDASLHVHRGYALESLGRTRDSLAAFRTAMRMDPAMSRLVPPP